MKIFLTGGTGFIGSHVLKQLLASDIEVIAHRRKESSRPNIPIEDSIDWLTKPVSDILSTDFDGVDVLLHLASHSVQYPFDTLENNIHFNVVEPLQMFLKASKAGVENYVVAGSCFEYGLSGEQYEFIPPEAPLEPIDSYSTSKAMAFMAFKEFARSQKKSLCYRRLFHVYGDGEPAARLWPSLRSSALNNKSIDMTLGGQVRDFICVENVAMELISSCYHSVTNGLGTVEIKNIGSGNPQSIRDFAEFWWNEFGATGKINFGALPYRKNEVMRFVPLIDE